MNGTSSKYTTWSRDALLKRIQELEARLEPPTAATGSDRPVSEVSSEDTPKSKDRRPFDFSKYAKRHIALKVAYFGWPYAGFASQGIVDVKTVESELFNALLAARLIEDPLNCNYTRCGRTDRGVSGLGQVIALTVRSALPKCSPLVIRSEGDGFDPDTHNNGDGSLSLEEQEAKAGVYWKNGVKRNKDGSVFGELPYLTVINRLLPPDIRVIAWAPVSEDFNARFHCNWREYKYFFPKGSIDIERMRAGAAHFLGTHDFRNFCKYDASKTIENYDRTVLAISIDPVRDHEFSQKESHQFYQMTLRGTAFLWHQVRCMMAVLFAIGNGLEEPEVIPQMMDLKLCPAKPNYDMASELPLVLYDCHFENVEWQYQNEIDLVNDITPLRLYRAMEDQWSCYMTKSLMYSRMLQQLDQAVLHNIPEKGDTIRLEEYAQQNSSKENSISLGGDLRMFIGKKYAKFMARQTCIPNEVKAKRHEEKRRLKKDLMEGNENSADSSRPPVTTSGEEVLSSSSDTSANPK
ncbi:MAG: pseudouridine synthase [Benniella sp.]|nr:MAG: pseudouridine synthase [Benniella sp.]